jgi:hypothetical protein
LLRYLTHPYQLLGVVLAVFIGLVGHNLAQAWVANALGDREPRRNGFLRPDLRKHLEPLGIVACALSYFGWGFPAPVPLDMRFRRNRLRVAVSLLAGPALLLALLFGTCSILVRTHSEHLVEVTGFASATLAGLTVLSLFPIPPLAGGRVVFLYAPNTPGWQRARLNLVETQMGSFIALGIVLLPVFFQLLPDPLRDLADALLRWVIRVVGSSPNPI